MEKKIEENKGKEKKKMVEKGKWHIKRMRKTEKRTIRKNKESDGRKKGKSGME